MNWSSSILWFTFLQPTIAQLPNHSSETVDWVVAMVDLNVITHSDLTFEQSFQQYFELSFPPLQAKRKRTLEFLIDIQMLCDLGNGVDIYQISPSRIEDELSKLRAQFTTIDEFKNFMLSHGMTESSLKERMNCYLSGEQVAYRYVVTAQNNDPDVQFELYHAMMKELWLRSPPRIISGEYLKFNPGE